MEGLANLRKDYAKASLDIASVNHDPIIQFKKWFQEAIDAKVPEPNAMNLATLSETGRPTSRVVLLKGIDNGQFIFFTNYQSQKGKELETHPECALNFFWPELERQIRIEGIAQRTDTKSSDEYFQSRPRGSQIGAWASPQSSIIENRKILEERVKEIEKRFEGKAVLPRPNQWGGYAITPLKIEFWQGRPSRLHDRICFTLVDSEWKIHRLAP